LRTFTQRIRYWKRAEKEKEKREVEGEMMGEIMETRRRKNYFAVIPIHIFNIT
jgi:hypothetical protein